MYHITDDDINDEDNQTLVIETLINGNTIINEKKRKGKDRQRI